MQFLADFKPPIQGHKFIALNQSFINGSNRDTADREGMANERPVYC
jgi:hypothetical protein